MEMNIKSGVYSHKVGDTVREGAFNYFANLSARDKIRFVNGVTNVLVDGTNYNGVIKDMIFRFMIVKIFTDVGTDEIETIDDIEEFLSNTDIVETVIAGVDDCVIDALRKAVDDNITYKTGIRQDKLTDAFIRLVNTVNQKVSELNVDLNDLMDVVGKLSQISGDITPEKIVEAFSQMDAFQRHFRDSSDNVSFDSPIIKFPRSAE